VRVVSGSLYLLLLAMAWAPTPGAAQSAQDLSTTCATAGGDAATCAAAAVAARAVTSQVGLMAGPGSEIPGEGSTLGRRLGGMPRIAAWVRAGVQPVDAPDPTDPTGAREASSLTPQLQAGLGLGVFDGFRLLPTVGGFLSLDVVGHASFLFLSDGSGFDGRVNVWSFGARLGILRESFTLPGVSVSVARRLSGDVRLGDSASGDLSEVLLDPSVTSLRATASKDLFAFGVLVGFGWDDFSSNAEMRVSDGAAGFATAAGSIDGRRRVYFASVTRQLGVLAWLTVEGGWADGLDPIAGYTGTGFDPGSRSPFASATVLLKL
jgi:hypothetical protein